MFFEAVEHLVYCVFMRCECGRCSDENVIHIDNDARSQLKVFDMQIMKDVIHHRLKGTWRICQPEEHNQGFEQSVFCFKHPFFFIAGLNPDVVIAPSHVEFGEDVGVLYLTDKVWYEWQG